MLKGKCVVLGVTGSIAAYKNRLSGKCARQAACGCACDYDGKCNQFYQSYHV